jgi:hypothetical protein
MTPEQHNEVLKHFTARAANFGAKPGTKRFLEAQAHFFCGAMAALAAVNGTPINPGITIDIMSGRTIAPRPVEANTPQPLGPALTNPHEMNPQ